MAGQIIGRGEGTWLVRVFTGRSADGKRQYVNKTIHGTKKEAQSWLNKTLRDHDLGIAVKPANDTLDEFLESWLEGVAKKKLRPKTFDGYRQTLKRYVLPAISGRPLAKISPLEIQSLSNGMHEKGLSARTIDAGWAVCRSAYPAPFVYESPGARFTGQLGDCARCGTNFSHSCSSLTARLPT